MGRRYLEQDEHRQALLIARATRVAQATERDFKEWADVELIQAGAK